MKRAAADGLVKPRFECPIHADYKTYRKYTLEGLAINLEIIVRIFLCRSYQFFRSDPNLNLNFGRGMLAELQELVHCTCHISLYSSLSVLLGC